ncbi:MAG: Uma2 family endonuclease [Calditrichaceae bacterium]|nr:Uma2 family endonuclease [Calditrichia bacterium]NUQ42391.1 Uma2 family endonuclease [Calditrichaceae bacterium]
MNWQEVCDNPLLKDLPFKIELNEWGQIVMTPASNKHGHYQSNIIRYLGQEISTGDLIAECSVQTPEGVKVADVVWLSDQFLKAHGYHTPYMQAPELCIEILSPSNTNEEMQHKMQLYFTAGAKEVWLCDESGQLRFFDPGGELERSRLFPNFPAQLP